MALNREYTVAEYLTTVTDLNLRKALTIAFLLRKVAIGRPGPQEKTGYVHTAHNM